MKKTKKIDYDHSVFTLATTHCNESDYDYAEYVEWCEDNNIEPKGINEYGEDSFWDWCQQETETNWEEDMYNIKESEKCNVPTIIEGSLGLWDGHHEIIPVECDNMYDAIQKCLPRNYDYYADVIFDKGFVNVNISHHDGTNCFTLRPKDKRKKFKYMYA